MADEVRTVLKDFNRNLLTEELAASVLPFESAFLAGFQRKGNSRFVGEPTAAPKLISRDGVSGVEDFADPGEIRFVFTTALTVPQGAILDGLLNSHDATQHTADQDRTRQDTLDYVALEAQWPNIGTMTNADLRLYISKLARVIIRDNRNAPI
jgi:hypothetical protein